MHNLKNTTFIIPVCIESQDRYNNSKTVLSYLNHHFETNVIVHEKTKDESKLNFLNELKNLKLTHITEKNDLGSYHRTRQLNEMLNLVETNVVVNYDIDIILPIESYLKSVENILSGKYDFVYPYQLGYFQWEISRNFSRNIFENNFDVSSLDSSFLVNLSTGFGHCFFANTKSYVECFGENENFIAYGPEDEERPVRFNKLGYKVGREGDKIYHFEHSRTPFSSNKNNFFTSNTKLYERLVSMDKNELLNYYKNQEYIKKYKNFTK